MTDKLKRTIIGAVIAVALAAAVSYGLISQQTADQLQTKADQTLQDGQQTGSPKVPQQPEPQGPTPQDGGAQVPSPTNQAPQSGPPAAR